MGSKIGKPKVGPSRYERLAAENKRLTTMIASSESQSPMRCYYSALQVRDCGTVNYFASGVVITITDLNGNVLVEPVCVRDGLSDECIEALVKEFRTSLDSSVKPFSSWLRLGQ